MATAALGLAVGVLALGWAGRSLSRLTFLAIVGSTACQLVLLPAVGLSRQTIALDALLGMIALLTFAEARRRGVKVGPVGVASLVFAGLGTLTAGLGFVPAVNAIFAIQTSLLLFVGILAGRAMSDHEKLALLNQLTAVACVGSIIGLREASFGRPLYEFTEFQDSGNALTVFRASAFFGHPLILAAFTVAIAVANLAELPRRRRKGVTFAVGVVLPVAGALSTQSRSIIITITVGIVALLAWRQEGRATQGSSRTLVVCSIALFGAVFYRMLGDERSGLARRFSGLSLQEQQVRADALAVATRLTEGIENVVGGGPRVIASEFQQRGGLLLGTVDNQYLTTFAEYGAIGLLIVLWMTFQLARAVWRRDAPSASQPLIAAGVVVAGSMLLLDGFAWPTVAVVFALGVGAATAPDQAAPSPSDRVPALWNSRDSA